MYFLSIFVEKEFGFLKIIFVCAWCSENNFWVVCFRLPLQSRFWELNSGCQICMPSTYTDWTISPAYSLHSKLIRGWSYRCHFIFIFFSKQHLPFRGYGWWLQEAFRLFLPFKNVPQFNFFFFSLLTMWSWDLSLWVSMFPQLYNI